jgi:DNA-binding response OmpR family regulator
MPQILELPTRRAPAPAARRLRFLVVEEDPGIRAMTRVALEAGGRRVVTAPDGESAIRLLLACRRRFDAMCLCVDLLHVPGEEVADVALRLQPWLPIIVTSSRPETARPRHVAWLRKPYAIEEVVMYADIAAWGIATRRACATGEMHSHGDAFHGVTLPTAAAPSAGRVCTLRPTG